MNTLKLILGSASPARNELLKRLQMPFEVVSPDIDETPKPDEIPFEMVQRLAEEKAKKVALEHKNAFIIGCDQVGTLAGEILNKPMTHENAYKQLKFVSGKTVRFLTGICLYDTRKQSSQRAVETYDVHFRKLTDDMIENYLQRDKPYFCAGSFHVEGLGITLIDRLSGDDYTALIGLPLIRLTAMLEKVGLRVV